MPPAGWPPTGRRPRTGPASPRRARPSGRRRRPGWLEPSNWPEPWATTADTGPPRAQLGRGFGEGLPSENDLPHSTFLFTLKFPMRFSASTTGLEGRDFHLLDVRYPQVYRTQPG